MLCLKSRLLKHLISHVSHTHSDSEGMSSLPHPSPLKIRKFLGKKHSDSPLSDVSEMAEDSNISVDHLQFSCSICLDLLKDPVTTPCGHSFCMACINDFWNQPLQKGVYSCPQCRETFMPRPVLRRNNVMAEVVEKLKSKDLTSASFPRYRSESGDVECDICSESKEKAVRSCLVCLASFCKTHLKPHYESPVFKKHKLVQACNQLEEKICSRHDRLKDFYCRTDQMIICALCMLDKHKDHNTASVASERTEKQVRGTGYCVTVKNVICYETFTY